MNYTICQAVVKDIEILNRIYTENMKGYVEKVYPWNPTLFCDRFIPHEYQVIKIKGKIIGFIKVTSLATEIYLGEIQIDRDYQNQGIGTSLIQSLIRKTQIENKKLWLKVIRGNPAKKLYQKLGFVEESSSLTHSIMVKKM